MLARVIGVHDQSETGVMGQPFAILRGHTEQQQGATGEPHGVHAGRAGKPCKRGSVSPNVAKRQGNTDRHRSVPQPMSADHLCGCRRLGAVGAHWR